MPYTDHRYTRREIAALAEQRASKLLQNRGESDFLSFAVGVIARRLEKDATSYRQYGPWWWALKEVMRRAGHDFGEQSDVIVRKFYSFDSDAESLVAADTFREWYMATQFAGSNKFVLDPASAEQYVLWDADMEGATRQ